MQINSTPEILSFLKRCERNLSDTRINDFLDARVTPGNMHYLQKQLKKAGAQEFNKEPWPSLFVSTKEWLESPYHKNIHLGNVSDDHFRYERETVEAGYLFNIDAVQPDEDKELKDWMKLRAMDEDYEALYLYQDDQDWMVDAISECVTNDPCAEKAHGNVLTFGLGIGYFVYMAMRNPLVESITVAEKSQAVIDMFKAYLLPQFPKNIPLHVVQGDAFDLFHEDYLKQYDYVYTDIWQSGEDGLFTMARLLNGLNADTEKYDFWIEDSCVVPLRTLIYMEYRLILEGKKLPVTKEYEPLMQKVQGWFEAQSLVVNDVEQLKFFLYDRKTLRDILTYDIGEKV